MRRSIGVFCGARTGYGERYVDLTKSVARASGEVIGVIPRALCTEEVAHRGITELHVVESMHERKALMARLSDAFVALPGGYGTMDEFCEILTWAQLGIHDKPIGLLNAYGYYDSLLAAFERFARDGFVPPASAELFKTAPEIEALLALL